MSTIVDQGMAAYYNRDPEALRRLLEQLLAALARPVDGPLARNAGPSSELPHTGNSNREIAPGSGPGNS